MAAQCLGQLTAEYANGSRSRDFLKAAYVLATKTRGVSAPFGGDTPMFPVQCADSHERDHDLQSEFDFVWAKEEGRQEVIEVLAQNYGWARAEELIPSIRKPVAERIQDIQDCIWKS
eukprot:s777_g37.t1